MYAIQQSVSAPLNSRPIDLMHDDVLLINSPPSLTFKIQMCSQRTGIEKNISMKCGQSAQKLNGERRGGESDQQNVTMHEVFCRPF